MQRDAQLSAWLTLRPRVEQLGEALCERLTSLLEHEARLKVHSIQMRLKDPTSLAQKLARPDRTYRELWDITDLLGLRVITYFEDEVDLIGRLIERHFTVDYAHSIDKRHLQSEGRFGYRSLHYICALPPTGELELGGSTPRFEVQIRTMLEHAWAEIEHDLGYKSKEAMPAPVRRRLQRLAGMLELADHEFVKIRQDLEHYAERLPERLAADEPIPIDRLTLEGLVSCEECERLDHQVAKLLGKPLGSSLFFPDYLVRMVRAAGFKSINDARRALASRGEQLLKLVEPYFAFAGRTWGLSASDMEEVLRGYPVFFLAHAEVLQAGTSDLSVNRVTRLARFYRELDYPEDEREAMRIASLLIETFRDL